MKSRYQRKEQRRNASQFNQQTEHKTTQPAEGKKKSILLVCWDRSSRVKMKFSRSHSCMLYDYDEVAEAAYEEGKIQKVQKNFMLLTLWPSTTWWNFSIKVENSLSKKFITLSKQDSGFNFFHRCVAFKFQIFPFLIRPQCKWTVVSIR